MTHYQLLLHAITQQGYTTYDELVRCYSARGYTYGGFVQAVWRGRQRGTVQGPDASGHITRVHTCPCCGRPLEARIR